MKEQQQQEHQRLFTHHLVWPYTQRSANMLHVQNAN